MRQRKKQHRSVERRDARTHSPAAANGWKMQVCWLPRLSAESPICLGRHRHPLATGLPVYPFPCPPDGGRTIIPSFPQRLPLRFRLVLKTIISGGWFGIFYLINQFIDDRLLDHVSKSKSLSRDGPARFAETVLLDLPVDLPAICVFRGALTSPIDQGEYILAVRKCRDIAYRSGRFCPPVFRNMILPRNGCWRIWLS